MTPDEAKAAWAAMTPEERLAMAKACPAIVTKLWTANAPWTMSANPGGEVARIEVNQDGSFSWKAGGIRGGTDRRTDAAEACYAALLAAGFVLDGEP